jgi:hypothetical protein
VFISRNELIYNDADGLIRYIAESLLRGAPSATSASAQLSISPRAIDFPFDFFASVSLVF